MSAPVLASERRLTIAQVAVELIDDYTGHGPIARVETILEASVGGQWTTVAHRRTETASGVVAFPGLGLTTRPTEKPTRLYRVLVSSDSYRPLYGATYPVGQHGHEFTVRPWDHRNPPATLLGQPAKIFLLPGSTYPRSQFVPTLYGRVEDPAGAPVLDALVEETTRERVLTDERGRFALPLRWVPNGVVVTIDARDHLGRLGQITVNVPADLGAGHVITVA